jgi:hypothetical protein
LNQIFNTILLNNILKQKHKTSKSKTVFNPINIPSLYKNLPPLYFYYLPQYPEIDSTKDKRIVSKVNSLLDKDKSISSEPCSYQGGNNFRRRNQKTIKKKIRNIKNKNSLKHKIKNKINKKIKKCVKKCIKNNNNNIHQQKQEEKNKYRIKKLLESKIHEKINKLKLNKTKNWSKNKSNRRKYTRKNY